MGATFSEKFQHHSPKEKISSDHILCSKYLLEFGLTSKSIEGKQSIMTWLMITLRPLAPHSTTDNLPKSCKKCSQACTWIWYHHSSIMTSKMMKSGRTDLADEWWTNWTMNMYYIIIERNYLNSFCEVVLDWYHAIWIRA